MKAIGRGVQIALLTLIVGGLTLVGFAAFFPEAVISEDGSRPAWFVLTAALLLPISGFAGVVATIAAAVRSSRPNSTAAGAPGKSD